MNTPDASNQKVRATPTARRASRARAACYHNSRPWSKQDPNTATLLNGLSALKQGDFGVRLPLEWTGAAGAVAEGFNELVTVSERANQELIQLRKTVGDTRALLHALTELKSGDFSVRLPLDWVGVAGKTADTFNEVVALNQRMASELLRLRDSVGREGRINQRASLGEVGGTWAESTKLINDLIADLVQPTSEMARVIGAVAQGDLSKTMDLAIEGRPLQGEFLRTARTVNTMVNQLSSFASEVTRVAREVGTEGKLGGQANVKGVAGTWKDLTDNVNLMASNLTSQVRNIAGVTTAVANGDLAKKITVDVKGEFLELKDTINTMVDQLRSFASEVTRVAREVGTEGKLGGQARVEGVSGTWKDLTDSVNSMAGNLTAQVRNIAEVTTAVAKGDLSKKIAVDVKGEILELKITINTMVDQLSSFASEVTRVAREVGTEGKLGGQAQVRGVAGTWKDLTDNVNFMASNLTGQVRNIAEVTTAVAKGDLSRKITVDVRGEILELKNTINTMVDQLGSFASEVTRVAREVGSEGRLGGQANVRGVSGTWKDLTDSVNFMAGNLTNQVRNIAAVTTAVATGDLSKKITVDVKGEILELKNTINTMVDQLNSFASEVTRVAREVGIEGKLGGQAKVEGVSGTWRDLTDSVNFMASNLTNQVRGIAKVVTAVAQGDLKRKLLVEAKGEIAELADTINNMIDTLATFAEQVTTVAREVGTEGKLGGQSHVPGAAGTWRDLNSNVNQLAATLTTQLRAISDVATAVTKGDLTRSITVEAQGEVAQLKDTINEMIRNLRDTTLKNSEQNWLKTNLANFTRMLQGQRDLMAVGRMILSELASVVDAQQGVFYLVQHGATGGAAEDGNIQIKLLAGYAHSDRKNGDAEIRPGKDLVGQAVLEKRRVLLTDIPARYVTISSGLLEAPPVNIIILPVVFEDQVKAVIELASFRRFNSTHQTFLTQLTESIGIVLNTIEANSLTEDLLKQSQSLTNELQSRQLELQKTNLELEEKARQLVEQNAEVERKNREVEQARQALEEKAEQLAATSRFKSEFLANMSHELRTPLNSLLILADQLGVNPEGNLTSRQVEFAKTIHGSGKELLRLINDILDLSKIESGTVTLDIGPVVLRDVCGSVERTFRPVAQSKNLSFATDLASDLPVALQTDAQRLEQVLKNLLSNACKFTDRGSVVLRIARATNGWSPNHPTLSNASGVIAFSVTDTGIGIPPEKHAIIFEAFQQADGSTSRRYGGTGLGLAISREIARLLGGEITLSSAVGHGSTFCVYLPVDPKTAGASQAETTHLDVVNQQPVFAPDYTADIGATKELAVCEARVSAVTDDRYNIQPSDLALLIAEDDLDFGSFACEVGRSHGFKCLFAPDGHSALALVAEFQPDAIILDIGLPHLDGWRVLDRLKSDLGTRNIPVVVITASDESQRGLKMGSIRFCTKPVSQEQLHEVVADLYRFVERTTRHVLVVEDDPAQQMSIAELIGNPKVQITAAKDAETALELLGEQQFDCLLLDLRLPGRVSGNQLLEEIQRRPRYRNLATVVYTGKELSSEEEHRLNQLARSIVLKDVRSPERLLDQATLRLHSHVADLSEHQLALLRALHSDKVILAGRHVLLVDDDMRNVFAMTSVLERYGMTVLPAESGPEALTTLDAHPEIEVVLMDIMLPEMDGYKVTHTIRRQEQFKSLPIIALTAKAMKGDREKCLEAGCSDYLSKPVDVEQLLSVLRLWLHG